MTFLMSFGGGLIGSLVANAVMEDCGERSWRSYMWLIGGMAASLIPMSMAIRIAASEPGPTWSVLAAANCTFVLCVCCWFSLGRLLRVLLRPPTARDRVALIAGAWMVALMAVSSW